MAYVPRQIPEEEQNLFARTEPSTPVPQGGGSAGSATGGAAPGVGTPTQFGSNAARLTDYLNANQEQVKEMGQQVAGSLTNQYNQTMGAIDQGANQFNQDVSAGYTPPDPTRLNEAKTNPTEFVKNQQNVTDFRNWFNPSYTGPQNFEGSQAYSDLNNQVNKAVETSGLVNSIPGLGTYLGSNMGGRNATPGITNLDAALLARNPDARNAIQNAAKPYQNLSGYLSDKTTSANNAIKSQKDAAQASGENIRKTFTGEGGLLPTIQTDLQNRLAQNQQRTGEYNNVVQKLLTGNTGLTPQEQALVGANPKMLQDISKAQYDLDQLISPNDERIDRNFPATYFSGANSPSQFSMENVASPEEFDRAMALSLLSGTDPFLNAGMRDQAGTMPEQSKYDLQGYLNNLLTQIRYLNGGMPGPADPNDTERFPVPGVWSGI